MEEPGLGPLRQVLNGRGRRRLFAAGALLSDVAFVALVVGEGRQTVWSWQYYVFHVLALLVFPLKFWLAGRRLHDMNRSMLLALPYALIFAFAIYNQYLNRLLGAPPVYLPVGHMTIFGQRLEVIEVLVLCILVFVVVSDLGLSLLPGTRGLNRFGPDPRRANLADSHAALF